MKVDTKLIAEAIAEVEALDMPDIDGIGASTIRIVVDAIGGRIKRDHPRFNTGTFQVEALPIQNERLRQAIIKAVEQDQQRQRA